jgi:hypothetical protein
MRAAAVGLRILVERRVLVVRAAAVLAVLLEMVFLGQPILVVAVARRDIWPVLPSQVPAAPVS